MKRALVILALSLALATPVKADSVAGNLAVSAGLTAAIYYLLHYRCGIVEKEGPAFLSLMTVQALGTMYVMGGDYQTGKQLGNQLGANLVGSALVVIPILIFDK